MNLHLPQSLEAQVELEEIAAIPNHIITPRHAKPLIGVYQDTLVGSYRLTRPGVDFTKREFMNLMMWNPRFDGTMPEARAGGAKRYTGQQILSSMLPALNIEMGNKSYDGEKDTKESNNYVRIVQGDIKQGIIDDDIYMKPGKGIIHTTYNDYGPKETTQLLDTMQNTVESFLVMNGFSVGISDLVADEDTKRGIDEVIQAQKKQVENIILQVHTDLFDNNTGKTNQQEFEDQVFGALNQATEAAGKAGKKSLSTENRLLAMVNSGSKGNTTNVAQMIACLGQQAIEGKRIQYGFTDRTLPHYKKYDDGAEARGFIESSFIRGLTPQEFYFHAMSGREGLIDTAVKTAETGYIQRKLIKAMEDHVVQHDGTVRDSNMNILQFHYGEDGIMATKIESQALPLAKMSHADIRREFGLDGIDWSTVHQDGTSRTADEDAIAAYVDAVLEDQRMLVEDVFQGNALDSGSVSAPVNLARMILNTKVRFGLKADGRTDLVPGHVLEGIQRIISRTQNYNSIWNALLRFHLAPHKLIVKERFTRNAFDALCELIVVSHMRSWVQPGEQVGIVAAQSIGEPSTQMTLNSVDGETEIMIACDGKILTPTIAEFIHSYEATADKSRIQRHANDQIYIDMKDDGHDWRAISCDENGKMVWTKLEAITHHPVVNADGSDTIIEVELESGRKVKATKALSFLTRKGDKVVDIAGADLRLGDVLPLALDLALEAVVETVSLRGILSPSEWLYADEASKAVAAMNSGKRHWFQEANGKEFTVPYSRSDGFRDAFEKGHNTMAASMRAGCVYPKHGHLSDSHIPESIPLDAEFGFLVGAYLAEGTSNATQVNITNNDAAYLDKVKTALDRWNVGYHMVAADKHAEKTGISGRSTSLIAHSTVLAKAMGSLFGRVSYEKQIPSWVLQAPTAFVVGLVDGYVSGDGTVSAKTNIVSMTSVSKPLLVRMSTLLTRFGIYSTMSSRMPEKGVFDSVSEYHTLNITSAYAKRFAEQFTLTVAAKQERLSQFAGRRVNNRYQTTEQVFWDKIVAITECRPSGTGRVYDLTVEGTRNFMTADAIVMKDTFHLAGVASKSNVTRGVPRLNELLKVTKNPKATSLTIYLKPEFRNSKEKAREVVQDLELTLLRAITDNIAVYWDPKDESTVVEADRELLAFYKGYEATLAAEAGRDAEAEKHGASHWMLRLELNKETMFNKNISMADVVFAIKSRLTTTDIIYSDYNSDKLVMRIRVPPDAKSTASALDEFTNLKKFQNNLLNTTVIRGVPGIKAVTFRNDTSKVALVDGKYEPVTQYILDTDGSNYVRVMNHPAVDANRLYTTNIHDITDILGLEATRATLYNELATLFESVSVNYRHLGMLCDVITRSGRLMSIDRHGVNKGDIGPLAKASFEETEKIMLKAALFGEIDPVTGVSANIMTGQPIRGGTAFSQILLDEAALIKLSEGMTVDEEEVEEEGDISDLLEGGINLADPCSAAQFQMNMSMPPLVSALEEPDVAINVIGMA